MLDAKAGTDVECVGVGRMLERIDRESPPQVDDGRRREADGMRSE